MINLAHNPKSNSSNQAKKRLDEDQVRLLEASFDASKKLDPEHKFQLARELGVPPRQIAIWYQNKRARWKNQSLEVDYAGLEFRLEAALAEKSQLEKEVGHLRQELKRSHDTLFAFQLQAQAQADQALSSCCDEGGASSSLNDDVGCSQNWVGGDQALQFEQIYASLMMNGKGSDIGLNVTDFWI